jgi:hypothetical protein
MPQSLTLVPREWTLLTDSDIDYCTVQMRCEQSGTGRRLYLARGTAETPPTAMAGFFLDPDETSGIAGLDLATLDPGGDGGRLWARYAHDEECIVWCSWVSLVHR